MRTSLLGGRPRMGPQSPRQPELKPEGNAGGGGRYPGLTCPVVKGINYLFERFEQLAEALGSHDLDRTLTLPVENAGVVEGEWVLASVAVGDESVAVAACVVDRGEGMQLSFEGRDWLKLERFAGTRRPPSIPPSMPPPPPEETLRPEAQILIVDQDPETQEVVRELLQSSGYRVRSAASAEQAFDELREQEIDLVLVENTLPGMTGTEFCERIRRDRRLGDLPLVFLSTMSGTEHVVQAFAAGADDYVSKPFRIPELSARVMGLLRRSRIKSEDGQSEPQHDD
jgi:two-component system, OmpR family, phosphate regulon response regulator PhoB